MTYNFDIFVLPFMQRAFAAGIISAVVLGWVGVYVIARRMSFFGDGIAHASLAGIAVAVLLGLSPLPVALVTAVVFSILIFFLERKMGLSNDAAIGILFAFGMALGVLLLSFTSGFQPELVSFLFGNILAVTEADLWIIYAFGALVFFTLFCLRKKLVFVVFDEEGAYLSGLSPNRYILLLYIITSVSVIISIRLLGIILTSALLILPAVTGRLWARSFRILEATAVLAAVLFVILGLIASVVWNIPSGAAIILAGTAIFAVTALTRLLSRKR